MSQFAKAHFCLQCHFSTDDIFLLRFEVSYLQ